MKTNAQTIPPAEDDYIDPRADWTPLPRVKDLAAGVSVQLASRVSLGASILFDAVGLKACGLSGRERVAASLSPDGRTLALRVDPNGLCKLDSPQTGEAKEGYVARVVVRGDFGLAEQRLPAASARRDGDTVLIGLPEGGAS